MGIRMRVFVRGLLGSIRDGGKVTRVDRFMLGELLKHMEELGERYYAGDLKVVDEFLTLYCCDGKKAQPNGAGNAANSEPLGTVG